MIITTIKLILGQQTGENSKKMTISFTDESEDFQKGLEKLKSLVTKGACYNFNGVEIHVKDEVKVGKVTTVEVSTPKVKGTAGIRFYSSRKSGTQVVVTRQAGQDFEVSKTCRKFCKVDH